MQIIKRDGSKQAFDHKKITNAINKSFLATTIKADIEELEALTNQTINRLADEVTVEQIQDEVEFVLMEKYPEVAQKYIRYREMRTKNRLEKEFLTKAIESIVSIEQNDITNENANMSAQSPAGQMMSIASQASKNFALRYLVNEEYSELHEDGYIHIHDLDYYPTKTTTCLQYDLDLLYKDGFKTKHGKIKEPQSIMSYAQLAAIAFQTNQNEQHGGQSIPAFDFFMAPGVTKSFIKILTSAIEDHLNILDKTADVKEAVTNNVDGIANVNIKAISDFVGIDVTKHHELALIKVRKDTNQAMEGFIHNLNTMHSRGGNQVVFSSINYGTDTSAEGRMVMEELLDVTRKGLGNNEVPVFPIQIFKVKEGVNISDEDLQSAYDTMVWDEEFLNSEFKAKNFDLFLKSIKTTATSLFPNFVFLDTPFNQHEKWQVNDPKRYEYEVATMGCRTRVFENLHGEKSSLRRGNVSFTTINMPRLAIEATKKYENSKERVVYFQEQCLKYVDIVAKQLIERLEYQKSALTLQFPFMMYNGLWQDGADKYPNDSVDEILNHGTLGIGFIGAHNAMYALFEKGHDEDKEVYNVLYETLEMMNERISQLKKLHNLNFSLLATPAEGLSGRFVKIDAKKYGVIPGVTDKSYYVNSFHVDVTSNISAIEKIKLEAPFHALTLGGHITYIEVDGEAKKNLHSLLKIVETMYRENIGYGSINHPVDQCNECNYKGIIYAECPLCGSEAIRRMRRITGYLTGDLTTWNSAKKDEEKDRVKHL